MPNTRVGPTPEETWQPSWVVISVLAEHPEGGYSVRFPGHDQEIRVENVIDGDNPSRMLQLLTGRESTTVDPPTVSDVR